MADFGLVSIKPEPSDEVGSSSGGHPDPVSLVDLEERILQLCSESPKGITDDMIIKDQPRIDTERRLKALQRLLSQVSERRFV